MKRGCSSSSSSDLSGGTGDINPQILSVTSVLAVANVAQATGGSIQIPNPAWDLNRAAGAGACPKAKAYVMEILKIWLATDAPAFGTNATLPLWGATGTSVVAVNQPPAALATTATLDLCMEWLQQQLSGAANMVPTSSCLVQQVKQSHFLNGTFGAPMMDVSQDKLWEEFDLTDEAGHGVIIGTQNIQLLTFARYNQLPGLTQNMQYGARILYRFKGVPYDEFIRQYTFGY